MQKVDGVEKVDVRLNQGLTVLDLKPGNKITLSQLRSVIRNNGFVSKEAALVATGSAEGEGFRVAGTGELLTTSEKPTATTGGSWRMTVPAK